MFQVVSNTSTDANKPLIERYSTHYSVDFNSNNKDKYHNIILHEYITYKL